MVNVLEAIVNASERAANVARSCCNASCRKALVVAEKCEGEANSRFDKDFKTIADVLAQECAKYEIGSKFPELAGHVRGEECSEIGGVNISLQDTPEQTAELLEKLVPPPVAKQMAEAAHCEVNLYQEELSSIPELDVNNLGVWIDPIDATAEFISGVNGEANSDKGLPCVTVLIGVYIQSTGEAIMGVINQPFFNNGEGRLMWGINYKNTQKWGGVNIETDINKNTVLMSAAEKSDVKEKFETSGWKVNSVPGAGHKLMKVALGEAAAYIVSKGTTFRWDTCAAHAILRAKGGDLLNYSTYHPIIYNDPQYASTQMYCNTDGIIGYSDPEILKKIKNILN